MNLLSDYQAHKRDEEYERVHGAELDRQWRTAPKCPIHHTPLVAGCGVAGEPTVYFKGGGCAECYWKLRALVQARVL